MIFPTLSLMLSTTMATGSSTVLASPRVYRWTNPIRLSQQVERAREYQQISSSLAVLTDINVLKTALNPDLSPDVSLGFRSTLHALFDCFRYSC
ncbi:hypothetical protein GYMLUDRAFT_880404 [Collybiopsis luxurians FD-317 M1]|uniref:Uncharacterized protein n=1 Tax=Collybiopsis luxurians FD-317 M1 TaxID=944289 RepID=A0A0D0BYW3_9AGAR|nr:hypothetical protein GYMLUDRAFT_880404 [Collybiopsis luxurians FD-317 M1]